MAKKKKKKSAGPPLAKVRLSQCMIVKNEEANIERALRWAKNIAFEQIVVDTGSTDRTVEIAEKMGAKVYHFEWINDFAAAKNFAIEHATGNWIAFLDADEYMSDKDAKTLYEYLKKIRDDEDLHAKVFAINTSLVNLDDDGKPATVIDQERIFRNIPAARYAGKIHEMLQLPRGSQYRTDDITILHTGYAKSIYKGTDKLQRNIDMILESLKETPDDMNLIAYLADGYKALDTEENRAKADELYLQIVDTDKYVYHSHAVNAYRYLLERRLKDPSRLDEALKIAKKGLEKFPNEIDINFFYGAVLNAKRDYITAFEALRTCEEKLVNTKSIDDSVMLMAKPEMLFDQLAASCKGMADIQGYVKYAVMAMSANPNEPRLLGTFIVTLLENNTPEDEMIKVLGTVYDFNNLKDLVMIARTAKDCGAIQFAGKILEMAKNT